MKKKSTSIILLAVSLALILGGALYLYGKIESDSNNPVVFEYNGGRDDPSDIKVSISDTKSWKNYSGPNDETTGAQYDGEIKNGLESDIIDWSLVITVPEDGNLDSSWNGTYEVDGNKITLTPDESTQLIPAGESKPFGFVMISDQLLEFKKFEFTGYRQTVCTQYTLFWVLIGATGLWVVGFLSYVIVSVRFREFERRRENDAKIIIQTMNTFAGMIDAKDPYTKGHSLRVSLYAQEIARRMGMKSEEVRNIGYIGLMHDCGKIGVPDNILTKPSKLSPEERKIVEEHTTRGWHVLENFTAIEGIRDGALYHHERYDGNGYPKKIAGADIPMCARIICVADAYDAMNSDRCYRPRMPREQIVKELDDNAGKQFDPDIVVHMLAMIREGFCDDKTSIE